MAFNRLSEIPSGILFDMPNLRHLDLSKNKIESIDKMAFGIIEKSQIARTTNLVRLNLAGNQIQEV